MRYDDSMDPECVPLCDAMNQVPGIRTHESCSGHGKTPFRVYFTAESLAALPRLLYYFAGCHCGFSDWRVRVKTDCAMSPAVFIAEGPVAAYSEAHRIAELLVEEMEVK